MVSAPSAPSAPLPVLVTDREGPSWLAWAVQTTLTLLILLAILAGTAPDQAREALFGLSTASLFLWKLLVFPLRRRPALLELFPGYLVLRGRWIPTRVLEAFSIEAASAARGPNGTVTLALKPKGAAPLLFDLEGDKDATRVRNALGLGHFGLGRLTWVTKPRNGDAVRIAARLLAAAGALFAGVSGLFNLFDDTGLLVLFLAWSVCPILWVLASLLDGIPHGLALLPDGLWFHNPRRLVPYDRLLRVRREPSALVLDIDGDLNPMVLPIAPSWLGSAGLLPEEADHLTCQLQSAADRAHGLGDVPLDVAARLVRLARGQESTRRWLERLDAEAAALQSDSGYRSAGLELADLWGAFESPDVPGELRAAAGRILVRLDPEAAKRVPALLATVRDRATYQHLRIATDADLDLAKAAEELEELEPTARSVPRSSG